MVIPFAGMHPCDPHCFIFPSLFPLKPSRALRNTSHITNYSRSVITCASLPQQPSTPPFGNSNDDNDGKRTSNHDGDVTNDGPAARLEKLNALLQNALARENFLAAAKYRDAIAALEQEVEEAAIFASQHENQGHRNQNGVSDTGLEILEDAKQDVLKVHDAFFKAFAAADSNAMRSLWLDTSFVTCALPVPPESRSSSNSRSDNGKEREDADGALAVGHGDVIRAWQQLWSRGAPGNVKVSDVQITMLGRSGIAYGIATLDVDAVRGKILIGGKRIATNIFARRMGKWWVVHYHASPVTVEGP